MEAAFIVASTPLPEGVRRRMKSLTTLVILMLSAGSALAQSEKVPSSTPEVRSTTLSGGIGNSFGVFGAQIEKYFGASRYSVFGAMGYAPDLEDGPATTYQGLTVAGGARLYSAGEKHRGFLELAFMPIATDIVRNSNGEGENHYGPGFAGGYQYITRGGFTFSGSAGIGYAPGSDEENIAPVVSIGIGYTWR